MPWIYRMLERCCFTRTRYTRPKSYRLIMGWIAATCLCTFPVHWGHASPATPCDGVDRSISATQMQALAPVITRQLNDHKDPATRSLQHVQMATILSSLSLGGWSILYIDTGVSDEAYVFYAASPIGQHFLALWAGSAESGEEQSIKAWEIKTMPKIPNKLASCFAWHVVYEGG